MPCFLVYAIPPLTGHLLTKACPSPNIYDIDFNPTDTSLVVGTYGRGAWKSKAHIPMVSGVKPVLAADFRFNVSPNPTNVQLKVLEDEFKSNFARIHKTYLANIEFIEAINPKDSVIVVGGETLPFGYVYRKPFFDRLKLLR